MTDGVAESVFDWPSPAQSPVDLLDPRRAALPLHGRAAELAELVDWCDGPGPTHGIVQVISAASGHGATRLGVELVAAMRARGWVAGMLRDGPDRQGLAGLAAGPDPLLVVVDDAEVRGEDVVALRPLFTSTRERPKRILLIGHADDNAGLPTPLDTPLEPAFEQLGYPFYTLSRVVAADLAEADRLRVWREAVVMLAPRLPEVATLGCVPWAVPPPVPPAIDPPAELLDRAGVTVPEIQFAALTGLLGAAGGDSAADQIVVWESWYWFQQAIDHELFFPDHQECVPPVAQAAIWGAGTRDDALRVVTGMLAGQQPAMAEQVTEWLSGLYPGPGRFWRFPRMLAAHLAATAATATAADDGLLQAAAAAADQTQRRHAAGLLLPALPRAPRIRSAVVDAAQTAPELWAPAIVHTAVAVGSPAPATSWRGLRSRRRPAAAAPPDGRVYDGILALVDALAISADEVDGDALSLLSDLEQALPLWAGPLGEVALAVTQKLLDAAAWINSYEHGEWEVMEAVYAGRLAVRLSNLGRVDEAAEASRRAADQLRPHAVGDDELIAELARILGHLAGDLVAAGRYERAAAAASESADLYRHLAAGRPDKELLLSLAAALIIHAEALRDLGQAAHGHPAVQEALTIVEPLARDDRHIADTWLPRARDLQPSD